MPIALDCMCFIWEKKQRLCVCACVCVCMHRERERKWKEGIDFPLSHCSTYTIYILAGLEVFQVLAPTSKERKSDEQSSAPLLHCFERKSPAGTSLSWPVSTLCIYIYSKYSATEREKRWQLERERRTVRESELHEIAQIGWRVFWGRVVLQKTASR